MPIQRTSPVPVHVQNAINVATHRTSASFDYLVNTARRESSFQSNAKSSSSSAAGLFQFVEGTWLKVVKEDGDRLGLSSLAKNIHKTSSGKYYVPDRGQRREILNMRHDPETSALVAAAYTEHNERYVRRRIGRAPSDGELYMAHFLGPGSAAKMIRLSEQQPDNPANRHFPAAAKANKSIFYENGKPRSLEEVHKIIISSHSGGQNERVASSDPSSFGFGVMGDLMADTSSQRVNYGQGRAGSIGVWGGQSSSSNRAGGGSSNEKTVERQKASEDQARTTRANEAERHRHAARQYRTAAVETSKAKEPDNSWIEDAIGFK